MVKAPFISFLAPLMMISPAMAAVPVIEDPGNVYSSIVTSFRSPRQRVGVLSPNLVNVVVGQPVAIQIAASGRPTSYSATGLPAGFTIDQATGLIQGVYSQTGTANVTVFATNADGTGQRTFQLRALAEVFDLLVPTKKVATGMDTTIVQMVQFGENLPATWESGWLVAETQTGATNGSLVIGRRGQPNSSTNGLRAYIQGPAQISFRWRTTTEVGFDFLDFTVNGDLVASLSGATVLQPVTHTVGEGMHQLDWLYVKDGSVSALDQIVLDDLQVTGYPDWAISKGMGMFNSGFDIDREKDGNTLLTEYGLNMNPNAVEPRARPTITFDAQGRMEAAITRNPNAFGVTVDIQSNPTLTPDNWSSDGLETVPTNIFNLKKREATRTGRNFMRVEVRAN